MESIHINSRPTLLSIVCPMKNEEENLVPFFERLIPVLDMAADDYEIICINDGSEDKTLAVLLSERKRNPKIKIADLSRNFGKEAALTCGIEIASGDAVIPMDADLQHPPEAIIEMVDCWKAGYEVVLAKRKNRDTESWLRKKTADWFYKLQNKISEVQIPEDIGDFRLMDRKVIDALKRLPERRRFMKGLFAWVGFRQITITFICEPRFSGASNFSGWKLWNFALEGITSFSTIPIRVWTYIGGFISAVSLLYATYLLIKTILFGTDVPGYASLITSSLFLGGLQLAGLGVLGEYIGRIYGEVKQRPIYIIRELHDSSNNVQPPV